MLTRQIILLTSLFGLCFSQAPEDIYSRIEKHFRAFEYREVIELSTEISSGDSLSFEQNIDVLRMQAIAYYSLDEPLNADSSFTKILKIDPDFELDSRDNSPKIINFFNDIKLRFLSNQIKSPENTTEQAELNRIKDKIQNYREGMLRSIVLPGWGHYYIDESSKARLLNIASVLTLAPGLYYVFKTNDLEKKYLNETAQGKIDYRYKKYNDAYHYRNYFITAYGLIWLYTQYDYFFRNNMPDNFTVQIIPQYYYSSSAIALKFEISF